MTDSRVALVTGAGRGIGKAIAVALAQRGFTVGLNDRDADAVSAVERAIEDAGGSALPLVARVDDFDACRQMVGRVLEMRGRIDALISNAGIASSGKSLLRTPLEEFEELIRVHALAALTLCQAVLPSMRARGRGSIVAISSAATHLAPQKSGPYTMAKSALEALMLTLAKEESPHGIHVNIVAPGLVDTRLGQLVRTRIETSLSRSGEARPMPMVEPTAVADTVAFCVSEAASAMNGQRLVVDHVRPRRASPSHGGG